MKSDADGPTFDFEREHALADLGSVGAEMNSHHLTSVTDARAPGSEVEVAIVKPGLARRPRLPARADQTASGAHSVGQFRSTSGSSLSFDAA
jgi:hypothetical protein